MSRQPRFIDPDDINPLIGRRYAANRCAIPTYNALSGNSGGNFWSGHYAPEATSVRNLEVFFTNLLGGSVPTADGAGTIAIKAAIEYQAGNYIPLWSNGSRTLTLEPGGIGGFRPCPVVIPAGTYFRVHTQVLAAAWSEALMPFLASAGEGVQRGVTTDRTLTSSGMSVSNSASGIVPCVILGDHDAPVNAVEIHGDSIAAGLYDTATNLYVGFPARAIGNHLPWINLSQPSLKLSDYGYISGVTGGSSYRRLNVSTRGSTVALCTLGRNDVSQSRTFTQIATAMLALWKDRFDQGKKVFQTTITTQVTSSDSWATQGGISPAANDGPGGPRTQVNDWLRDGAPIQSGAVVAIGTAGATHVGSPLHPLSHVFEVADALETSRNNGVFPLSLLYTADNQGVHPNDAGQAAAAARIDWRLLAA